MNPNLLYAWSGLGRLISVRLLTHRLILLCMLAAALLAGAGYLGFFEEDLKGAAIYGSQIGLAVFLSWAICRELHPDAPWAAFVAVGLASAGLWLWPMPDLLLLFCILLCLRLVIRPAGVPARPGDVLLLLGLMGWLLYRGQPMAGVLVTAAFWLNGSLPQPQAWQRYLALLCGLSLLIAFWLKPFALPPAFLSIEINILIIALATAFALFIRKLKELHARADADGSPLLLRRLKAAQVLVLLVVSMFTLWFGDGLFAALVPVWACFAAPFLYAAFGGRGASGAVHLLSGENPS
ncbi:hypothetical protein [Cesiribacter andamanensis]|uniref:Uncharacterized protein n=1 Tax=Cesiribacter andamanensis AMV16 TaxID=1279009 RepID=M7NIH7_9BACT|nr:hypothetical protein [Cesiribacter andamanensis]EMR01590.1 hypothetical protein ADICEAN_03295 [Cesiribacter andamanensis AMV16]